MTTRIHGPRSTRRSKEPEPTLGRQIIAGLEEALAYEREALDAPVTRVPVTIRSARVTPPPVPGADEIAAFRAALGLSQPVFAHALNVSPETVRAWEQGKRVPDGAALRLLEWARAHPEWVHAVVQVAA
ncbi:MAG: helix-turn-helix domain-containing protein [Candidatus Eremiobacteraeota bacterium]|nr:helix-turn-helix domain-containing protein [Candidatus Eremiobacteraeota bacterium]